MMLMDNNRDDQGVYITFYNCTSMYSKCEKGGWMFGGVPGTCDKISELCICPEGYGGDDDFDYYNDCHVNYKLRLIIRIVGFISAVACFVVTISLFIKLLLQWGLLYIPESTSDGNSENDFDGKYGNSRRKSNNNNKNKNGSSSNGKHGDNQYHDMERRVSITQTDDTLNGPRSSIAYNAPMMGRTSMALTVGTLQSADSKLDLLNPDGDTPRSPTSTTASYQVDPLLSPPGSRLDEEGERLLTPVISTIPIKEENENELNSLGERLDNTGSSRQSQGAKNSSQQHHIEQPGSPSSFHENSGENPQSNDVHKKLSGLDNGLLLGEEKKPFIESGDRSIFGGEGRSSFAENRRSLIVTTAEFKRKVTKEMNRMPRPSVAAIKELAPSNVGVSPNSSTSAALFERKRKRLTLGFVFMFLMFSIFIVIFESLLLAGKTHAQNNALVNFCLAASITSVCWGLWLLAYIWFGTLPSLAAFGKMFNMKSILIRYPHLMKYLTIGHLLVSSIVCYGFFFVLPLIYPKYRYDYDTVALTFTAIFICDFCFVFLIICKILLQQFKLLEPKILAGHARRSTRKGLLFSSNTNTNANANIGSNQYQHNEGKTYTSAIDTKKNKDVTVSKAKHTVLMAMIICAIASPVVILLNCAIAFTSVGRSNLWIFTQLVAIVGCIVSFVSLHIVINRSSGGKNKRPSVAATNNNNPRLSTVPKNIINTNNTNTNAVIKHVNV